jgi:hypothetical protein
MRKEIVFSLVTSVVTLAGCDTPVHYEFVAENSTGRDIILNFSTPQTRKAVTIRPHQSALLTTTTEITKTRDDYFKDGLHVFDAIEVTQDGIPSSRRISERRFWRLTWIKADEGVYTVNVDPTFF